jgi:hypothetical protein
MRTKTISLYVDDKLGKIYENIIYTVCGLRFSCRKNILRSRSAYTNALQCAACILFDHRSMFRLVWHKICTWNLGTSRLTCIRHDCVATATTCVSIATHVVRSKQPFTRLRHDCDTSEFTYSLSWITGKQLRQPIIMLLRTIDWSRDVQLIKTIRKCKYSCYVVVLDRVSNISDTTAVLTVVSMFTERP